MATSYFPFDAGAGSAISESQWQKMARRWLKSGVLTGYLNALAVTADGSGMTVSVNTGGAWVEGFYFENDAAAAQTIAAAHATLSRIDRIAVRLDRTANTCALVVLTGTAAASPVAPTLSTTDTLYEIGLATVLVDPAVGVIAAGKVTDTRTLVKNLTETDASTAYVAKAGVTAATVDTPQSTTFTSYTDLTTAGPAVTVTTGARALVIMSAQFENNTAGSYAAMNFQVSGATTRAAVENERLTARSATVDQAFSVSRVVVVTGLTAGSNTFTSKYKVIGGGSGTFAYRHLIVIPLD